MKAHQRFSTLVLLVTSLFSRSAVADSLAQDSSVQSSHTVTTPNLVAWSPDTKFYAFASPDGHIRYARSEDGATLRTVYHCNPWAVAFSADGRFLATAGKSCGGQTKLKVWNVAEGTLICQMKAHLASDVLLSFSPD